VIDLKVDVRLELVEAALQRMNRLGRNLRPLFRAVRKDMRVDQVEHRKRQEGPDGSWPRLAPGTVEKRYQRPGKQGRKRRRGRRRRDPRILGRLPTAMDVRSDAVSVRAVSRVPWSGAHEDGATVGHGSRIPKREFLWTSGKLLGTVARKAAGMLLDSFLGKIFG